GLWHQAAGIIGLVAANGYLGWITAALAMGIGTALVYPTLIAAIGDRAHPAWRASAVGVYRLWRDLGYAAGGLLVGITADAIDESAASSSSACSPPPQGSSSYCACTRPPGSPIALLLSPRASPVGSQHSGGRYWGSGRAPLVSS